MNVFLLCIAIVLLVVYMFYLSRRKDFDILRSPPNTHHLPKSKYEAALKDLNEFKKLPKPKSQKKVIEHNSEIYYLERRAAQILQETENEQKNYYLACKEREIAFKDYHAYFKELSLIEKLFSPPKIKELGILRELYLETEKKVELESGKFYATKRIRDHEKKAALQREEEIDRRTKESDLTQSDMLESDDNSPRIEIEEQLESSQDKIELDEDLVSPQLDEPEPPTSSLTATPEIPVSSGPPPRNHFGQATLDTLFPKFEELSYIDEEFNLEQTNHPAVIDASFNKSYFVSVVFNGRHQYKSCSFIGTDFSYSIWKRSEKPHRLLNCDFTEAKLCFSRIEYLAFYHCRFVNTDMQDTVFNTVKFVDCHFENCNLVNVDFSNTVMSSNMLEQIDFSACKHPPKNALPPSSDNASVETEVNSVSEE